MATKLRYKDWKNDFAFMQRCLNRLIEGTPTSELRNLLCDLNIVVGTVERFAKEQREVL